MTFLLYTISFLLAAVLSGTADTIKNNYSLQNIFEIAVKQSNKIQIIENRAQTDLQQVAIYKAEAYPKIDLSINVGYANQSLLGQPFETSIILDRIDGFLFRWAFSLQQPVFKFGQIINSFKLASLTKKMAQKSNALQRNNFFLEVIEQFMIAFTGQSDYLISSQTFNRSQRIFERTSLDFETGRVSKRELLRTEASLEGDRASLLSSASNRSLSIKKLNVLIGLPDSADYFLILDDGDSFLQIPSSYSHVQNQQVALKRLETETNRYLRKNAWSAFFPSIDLTGSIFNEFMAVDTSGLTELLPLPTDGEVIPEIPVSSDLFNPDLINYSIGLQLSWNIFDGKRSWAQYNQYKLQEKTTRVELEQLERENSNQIQEIKNQISVTDNTIAAYRLQLEASQKALHQADSDFQDGFIDAISYLEIEQEYRSAARNLDNEKLRHLLLLAQLRIALGMSIYGE